MARARRRGPRKKAKKIQKKLCSFLGIFLVSCAFSPFFPCREANILLCLGGTFDIFDVRFSYCSIFLSVVLVSSSKITGIHVQNILFNVFHAISAANKRGGSLLYVGWYERVEKKQKPKLFKATRPFSPSRNLTFPV